MSSLLFLQAGALQSWPTSSAIPSSAITLSSGFITMAVCFVVVACTSSRLHHGSGGPGGFLLLLQALLGGSLPHLALTSFPLVGFAMTECLMFTQPLFTGIFAVLLDSGTAPWGVRDYALAMVSLAGVVLIARPWADFELSTQALGFVTAISFAVCAGLLNVLLKATALRQADSWLLVMMQGATTFLIALVPWLVAEVSPRTFELVNDNATAHPNATDLNISLTNETSSISDRVVDHIDHLLDVASRVSIGSGHRLVLVGFLFLLTQQLRTLGLQRAPSTVVATLLCTQVAWAFALDMITVGSRPTVEQFAGAALIIGSAALPAFLGAACASRRFSKLHEGSEIQPVEGEAAPAAGSKEPRRDEEELEVLDENAVAINAVPYIAVLVITVVVGVIGLRMPQ